MNVENDVNLLHYRNYILQNLEAPYWSYLKKNLKTNWKGKNCRYTWLTIHVPIPDEERKISQIFIFTLLCGALLGFMKI